MIASSSIALAQDLPPDATPAGRPFPLAPNPPPISSPPSPPRAAEQSQPYWWVLPEELPARGDAPPEGYRLVRRTNPRILATGLALFAGGWSASVVGAAVGVSSAPNSDDYLTLFIPIGGPWATLAALQSRFGANQDAGSIAALCFDGFGQATGALLILVGVVKRRSVYVREDLVTQSEKRSSLSAPEISVTSRGATALWRF